MKKRKRKILQCNLNDQSSINKNDMQSPIHLIAKASHSTRYKFTLLNQFLATGSYIWLCRGYTCSWS